MAGLEIFPNARLHFSYDIPLILHCSCEYSIRNTMLFQHLFGTPGLSQTLLQNSALSISFCVTGGCREQVPVPERP